MGSLSLSYTVDLTDGREDVDCEVEATISGKYVPAKTYGPPENCHPAEYPDIDIDTVKTSTGENITDLLTPKSEERVMAALELQWNEMLNEDYYDDYDDDDYYDYDDVDDPYDPEPL